MKYGWQYHKNFNDMTNGIKAQLKDITSTKGSIAGMPGSCGPNVPGLLISEY